jgi:ABC-type sugar transport system permease subunit
MNQTHVREGETLSLNQTDARVRAFRLTFLVTLVLLVLQYVLGVMANLYVQLPRSGDVWGWVFQNSVLIQLHIYTGTLLIVVALVALILSIRARHPFGIIAAVAGLALLIFAWLSGDQFLATQDNGLSLRMALGFIGAFVAYLLGYYLPIVRAQKQAR